MGGGYYGRIGQYELRGVLGHGGTATVYRGYQPSLDREVAIKVISVHYAQDPTFRERFRREARAIARLRHPNILAVYDFGEEGSAAYLVTELIAGGNLQGRLGRPLRPEDAARLARQIGQALDYAHAQGLVHRDVKPANIYLDGRRAVLGDFGIAKGIAGLDAGASLTATGVGLGTPEYMAPEQALGEPLDGRADLYSLGVVLYEALTGAPPYHSAAAVDTLMRHIEGRTPRPRDRNPALSPSVEAVLLKALARDRADRYASGAELAAALEAAVAAGPGPPSVADRDARTQIGPRPAILSETQVGPPPVREGQDAAATRVPPRPTPLPPLPDPARGTPPIAPGEFGDARTRSTLPPLPLSRQVPLRAAPSAAPGAAPGAADADPSAPTAGAPGLPATPWTYPPAQPVPTPAAVPPPAPPLAPAARRAPRYLWIGLAAALLLFLAALGAGLVYYLVGRDDGAAPTAVANAAPTAIAGPTPGPTAAPTAGPTPSLAPSPTAGPAATATAFFAADQALPLVQEADTLLRDGRFTEAVAKYREALARNPDSALANRQLGYTLWIWNHEAGEIDHLDRATKLAPFDALAWAYLSFSAVDTHQSERAYAAAGEAIRLDPMLAEAHAAVANALVRYNPNVHNPDEAIGRAREEIERARRLDPDNLWTLWFDMIVLLAEERPEAALAPIERAIAQHPNWPTLLTARGVVHNSMGRRDEARTYLKRALELDPEYPYANAELGWLAYGDGDYPTARDYFLKALAVNDIDVSAHDGLGYTLLELGDYVNAVRNFERSLAIEPRDQLAYIGLGRAYLEGYQRYDDALAAFRRAIDHRPLADEGYIWVARTHVAQRRFVEAETTLQGALTKVRKQGYTYYWLGWVYFQQGRHDAAQPHFEQATQLEPEDAGLYYWLGVNLERLNRLPEAKVAYERALELRPDYPQARQALDDLNRRTR